MLGPACLMQVIRALHLTHCSTPHSFIDCIIFQCLCGVCCLVCCRALTKAADEGLLTSGFFWIPSLGGPTSMAMRQAVSTSCSSSRRT